MPYSPEQLVRSRVMQLPAYKRPPRPEALAREQGVARIARLGLNENPLGPSPGALREIRRFLRRIHEYPDGASALLKEKLAADLGVEPDQIATGNGADDILLLLAQIFVDEGDQCIIPAPSFPIYTRSVRLMGGLPVFSPLKHHSIDLTDIRARITVKTKVIFLCNPNNPTGTILTRAALDEFMGRLPDRLVVILDEAYREFVTHGEFPDGLAYLRQGKPVVIVRTFSKIAGLAGIRLGYAVGHPAFAEAVDRVRNPFNVNILAQAAGLGALRDKAFTKKTLKTTVQERDWLAAEFRRLGFEPIPSETNFVCVDVRQDGEPVAEHLLTCGIQVRSCGIYDMPNHLRVSVGTHRENARVIRVLAGFLAGSPARARRMARGRRP